MTLSFLPLNFLSHSCFLLLKFSQYIQASAPIKAVSYSACCANCLADLQTGSTSTKSLSPPKFTPGFPQSVPPTLQLCSIRGTQLIMMKMRKQLKMSFPITQYSRANPLSLQYRKQFLTIHSGEKFFQILLTFNKSICGHL